MSTVQHKVCPGCHHCRGEQHGPWCPHSGEQPRVPANTTPADTLGVALGYLVVIGAILIIAVGVVAAVYAISTTVFG